jgi:lysophospholipase L1-like esterase
VTRKALCLLTAIALVIFTVISVPRGYADPPKPAGPQEDYYPVIVVLDTSSSMSEASGSKTKIDAARASVIDLVNALSPNSQFGLIAYPGHNGPTIDGCSGGDEEIKLGPLDQSTASAAVRRLNPDGDTPTGPALKHAAQIIKSSPRQRGSIMLVSDGESNCGSNPCEVAKQLTAQGVGVRVNTVGLQISPKGAQELQCIANATGGRYADAGNATDLKLSLQDLTGARLTLDGGVPPTIAAVSGTGAGGSKVVFAVTNSGHSDAKDVRVTLDFRDKNKIPGAILVPRPVRFLGNISPGQKLSVEFVVRPSSERLEDFTWIAAATANNAEPVTKSGQTRVVEPFDQATGLLRDKKNVVILGDSYSSGEGTHNYNKGTDGGDGNMCHRSPDAYGPKLFPSATNLACSNAKTSDFTGYQTSDKKLVPPQLFSLRQMVDRGNAPDAVLLSIGGNDAQFVDVVMNCVLAQGCNYDIVVKDWTVNFYDVMVYEQVFSLADDLRAAYKHVNEAVNDQKARDLRGGKVAPIVVVPYPRILPQNDASSMRDGCLFGISSDEAKFLNKFLDVLNLQIKLAAGVLRSQGAPVYYAEDVIKAFQPDHTICDGNRSYANTLSWRGGGTAPADWIHENAHPNKEGYAAMARAISAWSRDQSEVENPELPTWSGRIIRPSANSALAPSVGPVTPTGGVTRVTAGGYAPGTNVVMRVHSTPRILGSATADASGNIDATVALPTDTPLGSHEVVTIGFDPNGRLHRETNTIWVVPRYYLIAVVLLVVGVAAAAFGAAGMLASRKRR